MAQNLVLLGPYPPPYGGVAIYMSKLSALLTREQECVSVLALGYRGHEQNVYHLEATPYSLWRYIRRVGRDALYLDSSAFCLEYPALRLAVPWLMMKKLMRLHWVKVIHDGTLPVRYHRFSHLRKWLFQLALASVDHIVAVSQELADWLATDVGYQGAVTVVSSLLPPVDVAIDNAELAQRLHAFRERYGRLVCSIGVFDPLYGFDQVVSAVDALRKGQKGEPGLVLIDGGFTTDPAYRKRVLGAHEWILPLTALTHPETLYTLRQCDAFVRAVARESYGLSRVEALWSGIPVVATNVGEVRGMLLYEYGDVEGLKTQLHTALFHSSRGEIAQWAQFFQHEAQENVAKIRAILAAI